MKYNDALEALSTEKWNSLSAEDKHNVLQSIEDHVAQKEGGNPCKVQGRYIQSGMHGITMGFYSRTDRTITINTAQFASDSKYGNNYSAHLNTVLHEGRHAYQHQAVQGEIKHNNPAELAAWVDNMQPGHYITYEKNPRGYYAQPIERDARSYADSAIVEIERDKALLKAPQKGKQRSTSNSNTRNAHSNYRGSTHSSFDANQRGSQTQDFSYQSTKFATQRTPGEKQVSCSQAVKTDQISKRAMFAGHSQTQRRTESTKLTTSTAKKQQGIAR